MKKLKVIAALNHLLKKKKAINFEASNQKEKQVINQTMCAFYLFFKKKKTFKKIKNLFNYNCKKFFEIEKLNNKKPFLFF